MIDNDIANSYAGRTLGVQLAPSRYIDFLSVTRAPTIPEDPAIIGAVGELAGLSEVTELCAFWTRSTSRPSRTTPVP